ncbi:hypothetical protein [Candidatus Alkanophaga liquidiphilum]|nr:hypothetical protein [Candidatus Alkanophaga liquidiphilum]RLG38951.1 MAG: hypothetical protein DRN91_01160 [Candidatus Alkanophagales archaeon]
MQAQTATPKLILVEIISGGKQVCMGIMKSTRRRVMIREDPPSLKPFPKYVIVELVGNMSIKVAKGKAVEWFYERDEAVKRAQELGAVIDI